MSKVGQTEWTNTTRKAVTRFRVISAAVPNLRTSFLQERVSPLAIRPLPPTSLWFVAFFGAGGRCHEPAWVEPASVEKAS